MGGWGVSRVRRVGCGAVLLPVSALVFRCIVKRIRYTVAVPYPNPARITEYRSVGAIGIGIVSLDPRTANELDRVYRTGRLHATKYSTVQVQLWPVQCCRIWPHSTFLLRVAFDHLADEVRVLHAAVRPRRAREPVSPDSPLRFPVTACPTTRTPFALRLPRTLGAIAHPQPKPTCLTPSARRAQLLSVQHNRARHGVLRFPSSLTHRVPPYSHPTPSRRPTGLLRRPRCDEERLRQPPRKDDGCHVARLTASRPEGPARGSCPPQQAQTLADAARRRTPTGWMRCRHPGDSHCS